MSNGAGMETETDVVLLQIESMQNDVSSIREMLCSLDARLEMLRSHMVGLGERVSRLENNPMTPMPLTKE